MRFLDFHTHPYIEKRKIKKYPVAADAGYARQRTQLEAIGIFAAPAFSAMVCWVRN